jgi:hypothetical protein
MSEDMFFRSTESTPRSNRTLGVTAIASGLLLVSAFLFVTGALAAAGQVALSRAAFLLEGLQLMGPTVFFLVGSVVAVSAIGLLGLRNWARRTTSVLLAVTVGGAIPAISSAVVDFRIWSLLPEALKVTICVVTWFYLMQPEVKEAFGRQRENLSLKS